MKIILLGYMASGKSTIGKLLSENNNIPFIDLDKFIEEQENKNISAIFKEDGEVYFRLKEHQYLKELLQKNTDFILSLGGGTPCYAGNMELILADKNSTSVYLKANIRTLLNRLEKSKLKRPLIADLKSDELAEFIAKHLFERSFFYEKSDLKIKIDNKSVNEILTELNNLLP